MVIEKINSNTSKWSVLGISLASILFSLLLIYSPAVKADDGGASATCANGKKVTCTGYQCKGVDGVGCSCKNADGSPGESVPCPTRIVPFDYSDGD
jgi:hypothetical protein